MSHALYVLLFVLFLATTVLPYCIAPLVRRAIVYWPATSLVLLGSGLPGIYLLVIWGARRFDFHYSVANTYLTGCVVYGLLLFLQVSAFKLVLDRNRRADAKSLH